MHCIAKTRFEDGTLPDFFSNWKHENSSNKKYERYVFNSDDYLGNVALYRDIKMGSVLLSAFSEAEF